MHQPGKFRDKILICIDCLEEFAFTIGAQEYFAERGFTEVPKRCRSCNAEFLRKKSQPGKDDGEGGMAVWQPKIPPGFVPPQSGVNWNVPDSDRDHLH